MQSIERIPLSMSVRLIKDQLLNLSDLLERCVCIAILPCLCIMSDSVHYDIVNLLYVTTLSLE